MSTRHLDDDEVLARLLGEARPEADVHAEGCPRCRGEEARLRSALGTYRAAARRERARPRPGAAVRRVAWGAVAAGLVAISAFTARTVQEVNEAAADHALLVAVQQSLDREVPAPLAPALVLTTALRDPGIDRDAGPLTGGR
jgi:hypothetical protein